MNSSDDFERDLNKDMKRIGRLAGFGFVAAVIINLALAGFIIWAIVELVLWVTGK